MTIHEPRVHDTVEDLDAGLDHAFLPYERIC
jgi:hypothetical protein